MCQRAEGYSVLPPTPLSVEQRTESPPSRSLCLSALFTPSPQNTTAFTPSWSGSKKKRHDEKFTVSYGFVASLATLPCLITDSSPVAHVTEAQLAPVLVGALARKVEGVLQAAGRAHKTADEEARGGGGGGVLAVRGKKHVQSKTNDVKTLNDLSRSGPSTSQYREKRDLTTTRAGVRALVCPPPPCTASMSTPPIPPTSLPYLRAHAHISPSFTRPRLL